MENIIKRYKACLDAGKTERECIRLATKMAEEAGYKSLNECIEENSELKAGDKVYATYNEKTMVMFHSHSKMLQTVSLKTTKSSL